MFRTIVVEKLEIHILYSVTFFFNESRAVCEIMWNNMVVRQAIVNIIRRMRFARWMAKAAVTHTHTHTHTQIVK